MLQKLKKQLQKKILEVYSIQFEIKIDKSKNPERGDYSTAVCFQLSKELGKNPYDIALRLIDGLSVSDYQLDAVKPGYINITFSTKRYIAEINRIIMECDIYGRNTKWKNRKMLVEYTDPNPFKIFHIGHLFPNFVGECFANLCEVMGANVKRASYQGDLGLHVAKSVWGLIQRMDKDGYGKEIFTTWSLDKVNTYMGQAYAYGSSQFDEDSVKHNEMIEYNRFLYQRMQKKYKEEGVKVYVDYKYETNLSKGLRDKIWTCYKLGRKASLAYFETIYLRLGTKFDDYYFESYLAEYGFNVVKENFKLFKQDKGAVIFKGADYGLHNRVFINRFNIPTYEAKDLGLALYKYEKYKYDESIIVTGNEIDEYFKVVLKVLSLINPAIAKKTRHISHGMMQLKEGKMSSRTGKVLSGVELLDTTKAKVKKIIAKNPDFSTDEINNISEIIAQASLRYSILRIDLGRNFIYDPDRISKFEGDTGAYLVYTYVRMLSLLQKVPKPNKLDKFKNITKTELELVRWVMWYPEVVIDTAERFEPKILCSYLFDLCQKFNKFYSELSVLYEQDLTKKKQRICLTKATSVVLKNGLSLLAIKTVDKM